MGELVTVSDGAEEDLVAALVVVEDVGRAGGCGERVVFSARNEATVAESKTHVLELVGDHGHVDGVVVKGSHFEK